MTILRTLAAIAGMLLVVAASAPVARASGAPIAILLNGERLALNPPAVVVSAHLLVPVRRIIAALGLDFNQQGKDVVTHVGYKTISFHLGSPRAEVDGEPVVLDTPLVEIKNVLYAPLRFFTDVLGAQASFDRKQNAVAIVAQLIGRSGNGVMQHGNDVEQIGTITAVDLNSDPPTVTLSYNASVRTVNIARNALIELQDINANVTVPGELSDVHPGDFAHLFGDRSAVHHVLDQFGSRVGTVEAVAGGDLVLDDGHVIVPDRTTRISIDGASASISDIEPGDQATVRYNIESNETREVLVSRPIAIVSADGDVRIDDVQSDAIRPLQPGARVTVTIHGTPGGAATFDIGPYVTDLIAPQRGSGTYIGTYVIPRGANFSDVPIIAHLHASGKDAAPVQAPDAISASSTPPGVIDFAPDAGVTVNAQRPAIYATFSADAVPVNASSIVLRVNDRDVTADAVRSAKFIEYAPSNAFSNGVVRVRVTVADLAGNTTTKSWSFKVHAR